MNQSDLDFLKKRKKIYPEFFKNVKVLELGSRNINGTVRDVFDNCEFIGVDWVVGKDVDVTQKVYFTREQMFRLIELQIREVEGGISLERDYINTIKKVLNTIIENKNYECFFIENSSLYVDENLICKNVEILRLFLKLTKERKDEK